jgi:Uncharacterized conserved protein
MIGVWAINFLSQIKAAEVTIGQNPVSNDPKKKYSLLEFGPGKGTLMSDIIRVSSGLYDIMDLGFSSI